MSPREQGRPASAHHPAQGLEQGRRSSRDGNLEPTPDQRLGMLQALVLLELLATL